MLISCYLILSRFKKLGNVEEKNIAWKDVCNELPKKVTVIDTNKPRKKQAIILKLMRLKVKHPELVI